MLMMFDVKKLSILSILGSVLLASTCVQAMEKDPAKGTPKKFVVKTASNPKFADIQNQLAGRVGPANTPAKPQLAPVVDQAPVVAPQPVAPVVAPAINQAVKAALVAGKTPPPPPMGQAKKPAPTVAVIPVPVVQPEQPASVQPSTPVKKSVAQDSVVAALKNGSVNLRKATQTKTEPVAAALELPKLKPVDRSQPTAPIANQVFPKVALKSVNPQPTDANAKEAPVVAPQPAVAAPQPAVAVPQPAVAAPQPAIVAPAPVVVRRLPAVPVNGNATKL